MSLIVVGGASTQRVSVWRSASKLKIIIEMNLGGCGSRCMNGTVSFVLDDFFSSEDDPPLFHRRVC